MKRNKPKYIVLYEKIKNSIERGEYREDEKIPSIRQLATEEGISKNTVIQALEELEAEGFIRAKKKSGYFVEKIYNLYHDRRGTDFQRRTFTDSQNFRMNLSHSAIDTGLFPLRSVQRIYRDILDEKNEKLMCHSEPQGMPALRESISAYLAKYKQIKTSPDNIVISSGMEYLYQIIIRLIDKNAVFGLEAVGYDIIPALLEMNSLAYVDVPIDENGIDVSFLDKTNISVQVLTSVHQFPTGCRMCEDRKKQVLNWVEKSREKYVIEDDYDGDLKYLVRENFTLKSMDNKDRIIYMGSFSNTISPETRISFMVLPNELLERYKKRLPFLICPVGNVHQEFLRVFLDENLYAKHINKSRNHYRKKREKMVEILKLKPKVRRILGEDMGLYLLVELDTDREEKEIIENLHKNKILIYGIKKYDRQNMYRYPVLILGFGAIEYDEMQETVDEVFNIMDL